jgi:hypothetical protein
MLKKKKLKMGSNLLQTFFPFFLCFTVLFAASCQNRQRPIVSEHKFVKGTIVGGNPVLSENFSNVVGLTLRNKIFCSGTLIEADTIYTASHCFFHPENFIKVVKYNLSGRPGLKSVAQKRNFIEKLMSYQLSSKKRDVRIYFGPGEEGGNVRGQKKIKAIKISPSYFNFIKYTTFYKLGLLTLNEESNLRIDNPVDFAELTLKNFTEDIETVPVIRKSELPFLLKKGSKVRIVGYGYRQDPSLHKRAYFGRKFQVDLLFLEMKKKKIYLSSPRKSACYGDSGGAAFLVDEQGRVSRYLGVINGGDGPCGGKNPHTGLDIKTFIHSSFDR